ncbi:YCII-related protein [Gemmatirosa kalamazoonensis]|uniref:YCII-related protein n=1 Tax=Gemmatirosa kalamazoonensis TaxID=861299 RepID=W0RF38_9BACT|nr:YciI family protein [Gemmatirosa kalamazoonensis]AHG89684.1 YCII-related protein [Gemmatirosa kalamazoonensis]
MKYVLLIYDDEKVWETMSPDESGAMMGEYFAFTKDIQDKGSYRAGEALQPIATATTVRVRGGKLQTTDGPFAETREQLGGFYLVDAENLDEAIAVAARIPSARIGSIEVRPVVVFERPEAQLPASEARATATA